jgi:hypothetical protein
VLDRTGSYYIASQMKESKGFCPGPSPKRDSLPSNRIHIASENSHNFYCNNMQVEVGYGRSTQQHNWDWPERKVLDQHECYRFEQYYSNKKSYGSDKLIAVGKASSTRNLVKELNLTLHIGTPIMKIRKPRRI